MSSTISLTMANAKPGYSDSSIWQGYSLHQPVSSVSNPPVYSSYSPNIPYHGEPPRGNYRSLDSSSYSRSSLPSDGGVQLTGPPPSLHTHHSYPSLKRSFDHSSAYSDNVQEFREDIREPPKPTINQDHRLLSFGRLPEKNTILDSHGRPQRIDLVAQLHGMFFLSELASTPGETVMAKPELTCYRRNLFQISGSVAMPRGTLSVLTERGERIPIVSMEVGISATESVDGHVVKLIVIPWKTPPPNSPEIPSGQEHEPTSIPLQPFEDGLEASGEPATYPIAYRRLQFRIATANNGRRRELQQHFTLHLNVVGTLANGTTIIVSENSTAPIVVRGRSPRNFQARKEIPLVGSSSSRGNPPELQVATNMMAASSETKAKLAKLGGLELPRTSFTFDSSTIAGSPSIVRQPSYSSWSTSAHTSEQSAAPQNPLPYPPSMENYMPVPTSADQHTQSPTAISPLTRQPYNNFHSVSAPITTDPNRYYDDNPRPEKSPRYTAPTQRPTYSSIGSRFDQPLSSHTQALPARAPEYFPQTMQLPSSWSSTSAPETTPQYGTAGVQVTQAYEYPTQTYAKVEHNPQVQGQGQVQGQVQGEVQGHYNWNTASHQ